MVSLQLFAETDNFEHLGSQYDDDNQDTAEITSRM